ncbi:MAG: DUF3341 domain-containing protein, partial [Planctomycetota bacterium]
KTLHGLLAEFSTPAAILAAAGRVRDAGYRWWDCHTPFPVHGLERAMGIRMTLLPYLVFGGGAAGAVLAMLLQWYTNATNMEAWFIVPVSGYAFFVSGKPFASVPAWIPIMFEMTVLGASITCFVFVFALNGLPRFYHPCLKSARFLRASDDRFFIVIEARDPLFYRDKAEDLLKSLGATAVEPLED